MKKDKYQFFINMDKDEIKRILALPNTDEEKLNFVKSEREKCRNGITVGGVYFPGGLYFQINYFKLEADEEIDESGKGNKKIAIADLRDNDWILHQEFAQAIKEKKYYCIASARQVGKTVFLVSQTLREVSLYKNSEALVIFGNDKDKQSFTKKIRTALTHGEEFIIVPNIDKDWGKKTEFRFGITNKDNSVEEYSKLYVYNCVDGTESQAGSGKSPTFVAFDEIGKYPFQRTWEAVAAAITGKYGLRCAAYFAYTGGDTEKAQQAFNFTLNPKANNLLEFETEGKTTGKVLFAEYRQDCKIKVPFFEFLDQQQIKYDKDNIDLKKLKIWVSDKEKAKNLIIETLLEKEKANDKIAYNSYKMFYPLKLKDILSKPNVNIFPVDYLDQHQEYINANPIGQNYDVKKNVLTKEIKLIPSYKTPIENYPTPKYADLNTPVVIYDFPKYKTHGLHVIGVDVINEDETTQSESLASFYVIRRNHNDLSDPFRTKIVASWTGRFKTVQEFYELVFNICTFYDARILYEHTDRGFLTYFENRQSMFRLIDTIQLQREINSNSKTLQTKGLRPTVTNQKFLLNTTLEYCKEELEDGFMGLSRIPDPVLCEELKQWDGEKNTDRYIAFSHAIAAMRHEDRFGVLSVIIDTKQEIVVKKSNQLQNVWGIQKNKQKSVFGF